MRFLKKSGRLSSVGPESLAFVSHLLGELSTVLDCVIPNFKLKYEDSEYIKADGVNTVIFYIRQIKRRTFFVHSVVRTFVIK